MEIHIKESKIIQPAQETPRHCIRTSDLDLLVLAVHMPTVYFYRRPNDSSSFFAAGLLKDSLSNVLVPFYPMAGRLAKDENGRIEIQCKGEGVLFLEAETNCVIDDFGDNTSSSKLLQFVPSVDYTKDISSYPLVVIQVTYFKCRGVCVGIGFHHVLADATSKYHFINSWAEMTRGLPISIPPFYNRTTLEVGVPTSPRFHHIEYDPPPTLKLTPTQNPNPETISSAIFKLSLDQINTLKEKSKKDPGTTIKYSNFEVLTAHMWRCVCKARELSYDQVSKLHIPTNGRSKLNPQVPYGFIGNVVFSTTPIAISGDIQSEPLNSTVERVHRALKRMDDEYMKSALTYLKQQPDLTVLKRGAHTFKCPNFNISKLVGVPLYDANFGWGQPFFAKPVLASYDGMSYILPSPTKEGSLSVVIYLETPHMQLFRKFFYEIFYNARM